jgi:integrase/recombinase XerD
MLIADVCASFMFHCKNRGRLSPNTIDAYSADFKEFLTFFNDIRDLEDITPERLDSYASYLLVVRKLAPATAKRRIASLKVMFGWLLRRGDLQTSPFARVDLRIRIPERLARSLNSDELARMLRNRLPTCDVTKLAITLLLATGMRVGELTSLRLQDVNLSERSLRIIGKGNRERRVFLPNEDVVREMQDYLSSRRAGQSGAAQVFVNRSGGNLTADALRTRITKLAQDAGVARRVTPHMFRHSTATLLIESGVDIRFVQRLLGHQSISTTQLYTHVSDPALRHAITGAVRFQAMLTARAPEVAIDAGRCASLSRRKAQMP